MQDGGGGAGRWGGGVWGWGEGDAGGDQPRSFVGLEGSGSQRSPAGFQPRAAHRQRLFNTNTALGTGLTTAAGKWGLMEIGYKTIFPDGRNIFLSSVL